MGHSVRKPSEISAKRNFLPVGKGVNSSVRKNHLIHLFEVAASSPIVRTKVCANSRTLVHEIDSQSQTQITFLLMLVNKLRIFFFFLHFSVC